MSTEPVIDALLAMDANPTYSAECCAFDRCEDCPEPDKCCCDCHGRPADAARLKAASEAVRAQHATRDALLDAMDAVPPVDSALNAIAAYAESVLVATDGMWPPAARATELRTALRHISTECRRESAATTTDEETA